MSISADFGAWVDEARAVRVEDVIARRGITLGGRGPERVGPCPVCGGDNRFSINTNKNVFHCRQAGRGGDAIALVEYLDGADFLAACETLTGRAPPRGEGVRASPQELAAREEARRARDAERRAEQERLQGGYRARARHGALARWNAALPFAGTVMESYLREVRGVDIPAGAHLRFLPAAPYYSGDEDLPDGRRAPRCLGTAPAMLAAITDGAGQFIGLHTTWIDLSMPKGRAEFMDPDTGEILPAKKVLGSQKGGRIVLSPGADPAPGMCAGEGIETTLAMWSSLRRRDALPAGWLWQAGVNIANLCGHHAGMVTHPTLKRENKRGHLMPVKVPGPVPDMDAPAMPVPESAGVSLFLADGDSEAFFTRCAMERAQARHAREGRRVAVVWPRAGMDFGDWLQAGRDAGAAAGGYEGGRDEVDET